MGRRSSAIAFRGRDFHGMHCPTVPACRGVAIPLCPTMKLALSIASVALLLGPLGAVAEETSSSSADPLTFERDVRPILKTHCFQCHGEAGEMQGGLDLRLRRLMADGGESGPSIVPGNGAQSYLLDRITSGEMPPGEKQLTADEIARIGRWIDQGAPTAREEPVEIGDGYLFTEEDRNHWSFQPVVRPAVPDASADPRATTPIDAFLHARLASAGLNFSPEADKRTLLRRATFDLTGLPPTPEQLDLFLADEAPDAYDRLIDRLLASPEYGERWARHWLDLAGYADSEGYANDPERKYAYKYRDYVIASLNADKPFDEFLCEQLAGDEMVAPPYNNLTPDEIEKLVATGFLRMAADGTASGDTDPNLASNQVIADTVNIVSTAVLGLTVGCAQCHDHRYDPIPHVDYFRLRAIFEPALDWKHWRKPQQRLVSLYTDADRAAAAAVEAEAAELDKARTTKQQEFILATREKELAKLDPELSERVRVALDTPEKDRTPEQQDLLREHPSTNVSAGSLYLYDKAAADELQKMADAAAAVRARKPVEGFVQALTEVPGQVPETHLFARGDHEQPKQAVEPGDLTILAAATGASVPVDDPELPTTGRRLAYAKHLTSGQHPLVARVIVNRVWLHHFGRGLVETPGDFGMLGARPTHPELLDWLAAEFVDGGWSFKRLHKQIMTSAAYRQSSQRVPEAEAIDPDNHLYARMSIRRLEAEAIRDAALAASGTLRRQMFGPAVPVMEDEVGQVVVGIDTTDSAGRPTGKFISLEGQEYRRSIYVQVRRSLPLAVLDTFDAPAMEPNCAIRSTSTVAPQALMMMNSQFMVDMTRAMAERVRCEAGGDASAQLAHLWRLALAREPSEAERTAALEYLQTQQAEFAAANEAAAKPDATAESAPDAAQEALASLCHALLGSNEFLYID